MTLYVVASFLFIYSTLLVCYVASKSRLDLSQNPVWMACDRDAWLPFFPFFLSSIIDKHSFQSKHTLSVKHTYTHVHTCTHTPCDKTCSTVAKHDSLSPVKNDGWMGCVGRVNCLVYREGQQIPMPLWHSEISWWSSGFWELGLRKRDLVLKVSLS